MTDPLLWQDFERLDQQSLAERTGARVTPYGFCEIDVFNRVYAIDAGLRKVWMVNPVGAGDHDRRLELPLLKYMTDAKTDRETGEWVSPRDLPGGAQFFTGVHEVPVGKIIAAFGGDRKRFCAACRTLGGKPADFADASYCLRLFPRFSVLVLLWLADEEFPARASMLVDGNAYCHLPLDAMLAAFGYVQFSIVSAE